MASLSIAGGRWGVVDAMGDEWLKLLELMNVQLSIKLIVKYGD